MTPPTPDRRIIPGMDPEPTDEDKETGREYVDQLIDNIRGTWSPPQSVTMGRQRDSFAEGMSWIVAAHRVRERRAGMEGAAKLMCELCRKGNICYEGDDTTLYFHDLQDELEPREWCEASDIWAALAVHDAAVAEGEKGEKDA